ncbi:MAG: membrane protein insertase YidC [Deltaproteobacteria bacterium]|nr:membrane protein insertase YidC [Deltaproteobacteria bacterium]
MQPETKRFILAIVLGLGILILYPIILAKFFPQYAKPAQEAPVATTETPNAAVSTKEKSIVSTEPGGAIQKPAQATPQAPTIKEVLTTIETPLYTAVISNVNGAIKSWKLKTYSTKRNDGSSEAVEIAKSFGRRPHLSEELVINDKFETLVFTLSTEKLVLEQNETKEIILKAITSSGVKVERIITFFGDTYTADIKSTITNTGKGIISGGYFTEFSGTYEAEEKPYFHQGPLWMINNEVVRQDIHESKEADLKGVDSLDWIGIEEKYFLSALLPEKGEKRFWRSTIPMAGQARLTIGSNLELNPSTAVTFTSRLYVGPKEFNMLADEKRLLDDAIEFGMFSFMAKPALAVLNFFEKYLKNYGLAIIVLTVIIKILFYPLTKISMNSMKDMKRMHPEMMAIREKFKNDKVKLNAEIMELYKRHKMSPLSPAGGCLPMLLQIPVFIALYEVLYVAIELRQAPFALWLQDLSVHDPYYVTPVLMGLSMFVLQKLTPTVMEPMQEKIMLFLPIVLTFVFLKMPSGLVLYWFINNLLSIAQQYHLYKDEITLFKKKPKPA